MDTGSSCFSVHGSVRHHSHSFRYSIMRKLADSLMDLFSRTSCNDDEHTKTRSLWPWQPPGAEALAAPLSRMIPTAMSNLWILQLRWSLSTIMLPLSRLGSLLPIHVSKCSASVNHRIYFAPGWTNWATSSTHALLDVSCKWSLFREWYTWAKCAAHRYRGWPLWKKALLPVFPRANYKSSTSYDVFFGFEL